MGWLKASGSRLGSLIDAAFYVITRSLVGSGVTQLVE